MNRNKMNPARRIAARNSMGNVCMTCGQRICWSRETPDKAAHKATFGHVVAVEVGGKTSPGHVGPQCWACNWSGKCAGRQDMTADVIAGTVPATWLPTKTALAMPDVRDSAPDAVAASIGKAARAAARKARGLTW